VAAGADARAGVIAPAGPVERLRLEVGGAVQGVGFRPFVYRLAHRFGLAGWITNDPAGVTIEVEGDGNAVAEFAAALRSEAPPLARIQDVITTTVQPEDAAEFVIRTSRIDGARTAVLLPDAATCDECLADVRGDDPRRAGYAFTNCTNCGPRFSIIEALPYDRPGTTMAAFGMCPACAAEYHDPADRRFHAQPTACTACGPRLALRAAAGAPIAADDPIAAIAAALRRGAVVAVKGIGGFHLMVDARDADAIARLRERKGRPTKPLAVMAASVAEARGFVTVTAAAARLLESPEAPIVLLPRAVAAEGVSPLPDSIAPGNPTVGVMLPATPLHHLLLAAFGGPVVATSGNLSEEPICIDDDDAVMRLAGIADLFLVHDRPIARHVDDSVADIHDGGPRLLRRARGYAPLPIRHREPLPPILAAGAHMKNALGLSRGTSFFLSQHIGDLDAAESRHAFERVADDFLRLYDVKPVALAHDAHPDYASTVWALDAARRMGVPAIAVQHHHAHLASCLAEHGEAGPALGIIWDGTGYGGDGTIWGGEFLLGDATGFVRTGHLLPFRLPGGDAASRDPLRSAAALLHATFGPDALEPGFHPALAPLAGPRGRNIARMLETGLNSPYTTSAGRLFDGIAALLGLCRTATFEGEPAIALEHAAAPGDYGSYPFPVVTAAGRPALLDWRPMIAAALADHGSGTPAGIVSARVHGAMVEAMAGHIEAVGCGTVVLSGGCFQNRRLGEDAAGELRRRGIRVLVHRQVPPNDGGVALGQLVIAAARIAGRAPAMAAHVERIGR
jgi:hydrogenase maturation protein HypF